jgi:hypothetical protein
MPLPIHCLLIDACKASNLRLGADAYAALPCDQVNLFQKILFCLWFLASLFLTLLYLMLRGEPIAPGESLIENILIAELIVSLVFGVPFFVFASSKPK